MDFPVTAEFVASANAGQLHDEARGASAEWPACFVETPTGWAYRVEERPDVTIDPAAVQAALDGHAPEPLPPTPQDEFDQALADAASAPTLEGQVDALFATLAGTNLPAKAAARGKPA